MKRAPAIAFFVLSIALILSLWMRPAIPVQAQANFCDQTIVVSAAASASSTIFGAVPGATIYVCAYDFSGDTASTTATWKSGTTSLSGAELAVANGHFSAGDGNSILIQGATGSNMTIAAATGAIAGWVRAGQH
jgi:hypothetical protein